MAKIQRPLFLHPDGDIGARGLYPLSPFGIYRLWELLVAITGVCLAFWCPFDLAFKPFVSKGVEKLNYVAHGIFFANIVISLLVAHVDHDSQKITYDRVHIAANYVLFGPCALDILASIRVESLNWLFLNPKHMELYNFVYVVCVHKLYKLFTRMEKNRRLSYLAPRLRIIFEIIFSVHLLACISYYAIHEDQWMGMNMKAEAGCWRKYLNVVYYTVTTLSTVGYGDLHPSNDKEKVLCLVLMLCNLGLGAYFIGTLTNLLAPTAEATETMQRQRKVKEAVNFAERNKFSSSLRHKIAAHCKFVQDTDSQWSELEIYNSLPYGIRLDIKREVFCPQLKNLYIFKGFPSEFFPLLDSKIKVELFGPNIVVTKENMPPRPLYIVLSGQLLQTFLEPRKKSVVKTGEMFGELEVAFSSSPISSVTTKMPCVLLSLCPTTMDLCRQNGFEEIFIENVLEHLEEKNLVHLLKDLVKSRGPDRLFRSGRTALHIAANQGYLECVRALVDVGASKDMLDTSGDSPIWISLKRKWIAMGNNDEQSREKHEAVIRFLLSRGATIKSVDPSIVAEYACNAVRENNQARLDEIGECGGDFWKGRQSDQRSPVELARQSGNNAIYQCLMKWSSPSCSEGK